MFLNTDFVIISEPVSVLSFVLFVVAIISSVVLLVGLGALGKTSLKVVFGVWIVTVLAAVPGVVGYSGAENERMEALDGTVAAIEAEYEIEVVSSELRLSLSNASEMLVGGASETSEYYRLSGFVYKYDESIYVTDLLLLAERSGNEVIVSLFNGDGGSEKMSPFEAGSGGSMAEVSSF